MASGLGLQYLPTSHKKDARLIGVKSRWSIVYIDGSRVIISKIKKIHFFL